MRKQHLDSIYEAEPGHVPGRRHVRQDYKVSINRPQSKSLFRQSRNKNLVNQGAQSAAFLRQFVNGFFEKSRGIYKNGVLEAA